MRYHPLFQIQLAHGSASMQTQSTYPAHNILLCLCPRYTLSSSPCKTLMTTWGIPHSCHRRTLNRHTCCGTRANDKRKHSSPPVRLRYRPLKRGGGTAGHISSSRGGLDPSSWGGIWTPSCYIEMQGGESLSGICSGNIIVGDVAIFDSRLLHAGGANTSNRRRILFYFTASAGQRWPLPNGLHGSNSMRKADRWKYQLCDFGL